jgi:hypothetical protein
VRSLPVLNDDGGLPPHPPELLKGTVSADGRQRYCTYPFRVFGIASDILKPCTWLRQVSGVSVVPVSDGGNDLPKIWRGEVFDNVRRSIAAGEYHFCNLEFCPEYKGEQKYFLTTRELRVRFPEIAAYVSGATDGFAGGPELVNVSYDTGCNLSCPSCNRRDLPKLPRDQVDGFARSLDQLSASVKYIFLAGMGDPFGTPHYYDWLRNVEVHRYPRLKDIILNTNGLLWNEETWSAIPRATRARVRTAVISIDGASAATYEVNRWPGKWEDLMKSLAFIASLRRRGELDILRAYFVYQANNYHELPAMVQVCRDHAFDVVFFARIWNWNGVPQSDFDATDVANPEHRAHQDYLRVAEQVTRLGDEHLQIVVMR